MGLCLPGCDRTSPPPPAATTPRVACLVPAATDLLIGMDAGDTLVAISNWDPQQAATADLPRVGDYRTVDWEKIAQIRPTVLIVQFAADKMPPGLADRAEQMHIRLVNVHNNRLDELFTTITQLGEAIGRPEQAAAAARALRGQLDAVRARVAGLPAVRTLISREQNPLDVVGGGNFMDEILTIAGGKNVIEGGDNSYPTIDKERLGALNPDTVLQVLPGASPQVQAAARQAWETMPPIAAVEHGRVYLLTDDYLLLPGYSVGKMAERFAEKLHPPVAGKDAP